MRNRSIAVLCFTLLSLSSASAAPLGAAFTYQGKLAESGLPANGSYDLKLTLFDAAGAGNAVSGPITNRAVTVSDGLFTTTLDFGDDVFSGELRWLEIGVRTNGSGVFSTLSPRQVITPTPYALFAPSAGVAASASSVEAGSIGNMALAPGAVDSSRIADGSIAGADLSPALLNSTFWRLGGNSGTIPGTHFLGTTDNQPVEIKVNDQRVLRIEPYFSPSIIGGHNENRAGAGIFGATIAGGGKPGEPNVVEGTMGSIVGGTRQYLAGPGGFIGGGYANQIASNTLDSVIVGGFSNRIGSASSDSVIGGGLFNSIWSLAGFATISGGKFNTVSNHEATVSGGAYNQALGFSSTVGGGGGNVTRSDWTVIAAGRDNGIGQESHYGAVGGGYKNEIQGWAWNSSIAGGYRNNIGINSHSSNIGGGTNNNIAATSWAATIAGGCDNKIGTNAPHSAIGGGYDNHIAANSLGATITCGLYHEIGTDSDGSVISGGYNNRIRDNSWDATIAGGEYNSIGTEADFSAIGGGSNNGIAANAQYATIPGGRRNSATSYAFAAGRRAKANHTGAFVWADSHDVDFASTAINQFSIRASGGVRLSEDTPELSFGSTTRQMLNLYSTTYGLGVQSGTLYQRANTRFSWFRGGTHSDTQNDPGTNGTVLMTLTSGGLTVNGTFVSASDRNSKEGFERVHPNEVLDKVLALPLARWSYKADEERSRHLGPMAQDFHAAFGLGADDKHIATVDADGVALAAIQGLNQKVEDSRQRSEVRIQKLEAESAALLTENAELKQRLAALERLVQSTIQTRKPE